MDRFNSRTPFSTLIIGAISLVFIAQAQAETEFRAKYFYQTYLGQDLRESGINEGILLDSDLIRGNNSEEAVIAVSTNPINTNPFEFFNDNSTERLMEVTFDDGTILEDVWGLYDFALFNYGVSVAYYLVRDADLVSAGKTVDEIVDVVPSEAVELSLHWSDLGFVEYDLPSPDPIPTEDDIIIGTAGNDRLVGTEGVDVFLSGAGSRDLMTGGESGDYFVVGADVNNGARNRDIIQDFEPGKDVLVIENSAMMRSAGARNGNFIIQFQGDDRDSVLFRNSSVTSATEFEIIFLNGEFDISDLQSDSSSAEANVYRFPSRP